MARKRDSFFERNWQETRDHREHVRERSNVVVTQVKGRLQVVAPYDETFRGEARKLKGRWRYRSRMWSFAGVTSDQRDTVAALIAKVYGSDAVPPWLSNHRCQCGKTIHLAGKDLCVSCEQEQRSLQRLTQ